MKIHLSAIVVMGIAMPFATQHAAIAALALGDCVTCSATTCDCTLTTHKYCCPTTKSVPECPTGWTLNAKCDSCSREAITTTSNNRYTTTTYTTCSPTKTDQQCMESTATDTCGKGLLCRAQITI